MPSEKQQFIDWLYRAEPPEGMVDFNELLRTATVEVLGREGMEAEDYVHSNARRIWNALMEAIETDQKKGLCCILDSSSDGSRRTIWRRSISALRRGERARHLRAYARHKFLRVIDNLSAREYEAAGCVAAETAGADQVLLTPRGNEGGVDFFARLKQPGTTHIFSGARAPIRLVGQSKKYEERVSVNRVRDFMTTLSQICYVSAHFEALVPAWFRDASGPIVGWMVSHTGFQSGAVTLARNFGIVTSTSLDLAEISSQSRKIPLFADLDQRTVLFKNRVVQLVSGSA